MSVAKHNLNEPPRSHEKLLIEELISAIGAARTHPVYLKIETIEGDTFSISQVHFLNTEELAVLARVEQRTVRVWREKGVGPTPYRLPGSKSLLFDLAETIEFIKSHPVDQNGAGHR